MGPPPVRVSGNIHMSVVALEALMGAIVDSSKLCHGCHKTDANITDIVDFDFEASENLATLTFNDAIMCAGDLNHFMDTVTYFKDDAYIDRVYVNSSDHKWLFLIAAHGVWEAAEFIKPHIDQVSFMHRATEAMATYQLSQAADPIKAL